MSNVGLNTGLSALLSARYMLDTIGHNIANANTPGYSRQRVNLASGLPLHLGGLLIGGGVNAGSVQRSVDELLGRRIQSQRSLLGSLGTQREGLASLEALLAEPGENGLGGLLDDFFANVSQLSTAPSDSILRTSLVQSTSALTGRFRDLSDALGRTTSDATADVTSRVGEVNELASEIVALNLKIGETESVNLAANDLRDARDEALARLSELVDTTVVDGPNGSVRVLVSGNTLVGSARANSMRVTTDAGGEIALQMDGASGFVPVHGGEIGGLLRLGGELAPAYRTQLDQLAHQLILELNRVHSTGVAGSGPFQSLTAANALEDFDGDGRVSDELVANAGLPFDVVSGTLHVNVVDSQGGVEQHRIDLDATHTTVQDLVDELNEIPHLSASVDATGHLRIGADSGFGFDFSPRIDADPDPDGVFGGARATLGTPGSEPFTLADGATLDFTVSSGGTPVSFSIAFASADFHEISAATADEVAAAVNADAGAQSAGLHAVAVDGHVYFQTLSEGTDAVLSVDGGTAVAGLGLTGFVGVDVAGQANSVDVRLGGAYTGASDERFVFRPTLDGTIGTTEGLQVEVLDRAGNRVALLDVGAGYAPGTELEVSDGVTVTFGLGELSATDSERFEVELVADSDSSDVLVAFGLNGLLVGSDAHDIALAPGIEADPANLSLSLSGEAGDGSVLLEMLDVDRRSLAGLDGATLGGFWGELAGGVGFEASLADSAIEAGGAVLESLEQRKAAVSGVNVDEELVDLVNYEQSFAAAAQYLSVVNQVGEELLSLL